jgi:hypothetical protein
VPLLGKYTAEEFAVSQETYPEATVSGTVRHWLCTEFSVLYYDQAPGAWTPPTTDQGQVRWRLRLVVGGMITDGVKLRRVKLVRGISQSAKASRSFLPVRQDFERFFG